MLVLTRKIGESVVIDGEITVQIAAIQGNRVKLCFDGPSTRRFVRAEILKRASTHCGDSQCQRLPATGE